MSGDDLRALLGTDHVTHVPGVYDPVSAALAVRAGHKAVHLSGAAVSALMLGRPDLDYVPATQIADRATTLVQALGGVPMLADADTGYGAPTDAVWTALAYVRSGISGLRLEDKVSGRTEIIDLAPAAAKVAALAAEVPQLAVIASTGAYATTGLAETIVRCRAYAEAGADAVLPEGVDDPEDLAKLHHALPAVPIVVSRSEAAGDPPAATDADLAEVGVRLVLHPLAALLAALRAASLTYRAILDDGTARRVDRLPWAAFTDLVGRAGTEPDTRFVPERLQT